MEPDAYILAIMLAFYGIFRIGEIKALSWNSHDKNTVVIRQQLVEERTLEDDLSLGTPQKVIKQPKGNPYYSIRTETLSDQGVAILKKMKEINPDGELLFMYEGRPLTTETFNRRLKKYCNAVGIPYLSSHKIRFTGASMLYNAGVKPIDIQPLLGHSTLSMTEHYIGQRVQESPDSQMARILA
ncbi:MAG TPA: tyrosine-type recombinase/integrase [Candidatus Mediterraneibacter stercoravium]|uniref:Tyrosine-type recombinase/integrase n=1 Tax=Candidatus Mediterraneibacter stercoravium TaxID=2838685 RepID=A0A9D2K164_9FIRM|nr:tyrosine-type recombinase/integrase [Candidatus Mediterraneibacter stercoravium]